MALSNEFVKRLIFSPSNRAAVNNMATTIRQSYKEIIRESGWINDAAKLKALEKVEGMGQFVGYPDWVANDTWIEELFGTVSISFLRTLGPPIGVRFYFLFFFLLWISASTW